MTNLLTDPVIGIPINADILSFQRQQKRLMLHPVFQDHVPSNTKHRISVICKMTKLGEKMDYLAQGIREHVSQVFHLCPCSEAKPKADRTVKGKLILSAKILQVGGLERIFKKLFSVKDGEKLLKVSQCYLSTTAGPMAGLLFISTNKVAFCSERSVKISSPTGKLLRICYKVMIPVSKIYKAKESENIQKPSRKYIQIVTEDDFEFWLMGFFNHQKTLKYLHQAISGSQAC